MKKILIFLLILTTLALWGCDSAEEPVVDPVVEAYRVAAKGFLDQGDAAAAVEVLTKGVEITGNEELAAMLTAAEAAVKATETTEPPTTESTEPPTTEPPVEPAVIPLELKNGSFIPQFQLPQGDPEELNAELYDTCSQVATLEHAEFSYEWFHNGDILSLVTSTNMDGWQGRKVYNVSISTGERLDNAAILAALGWDQESYMRRLRLSVAACYDEHESWNSDEDAFWDRKENTLSDENLAEASLYLGQDGTVWAAVTLEIYAGSGETETVLQIPEDAETRFADVALVRPEPKFDIYSYVGDWAGDGLFISMGSDSFVVEGYCSNSTGTRVASIYFSADLYTLESGYGSFWFQDSFGNYGVLNICCYDGYIYAYVSDFQNTPGASWGFYLEEFYLYRS